MLMISYVYINFSPSKCTRLFIGALFVIASTRKLPQCPSTVKWIKCAISTQCNATEQ